jgi:hypothetical protein
MRMEVLIKTSQMILWMYYRKHMVLISDLFQEIKEEMKKEWKWKKYNKD